MIEVGSRVKILQYRTWKGYEGEVTAIRSAEIWPPLYEVQVADHTLILEESAVELVHPLVQLGREAE